MLTLFILPKGKNDNARKLIDSLSKIPIEIKYVSVDNVAEINGYDKKTEWFGVFYENEYIEEQLAVAFPTFFTLGDFDFLVLFKKLKDKASFSPRLYKSKIYLDDDLTPISKFWKHEKILNGWFFENAN